MGEIVDWRSFFPRCFLGQAHSRPRVLESSVIHQSTWFRPRMCLWGFHRYILSHGELSFKKSLILRSSMGISSLNAYAPISAQKKRIVYMLDGSKCSSRQDTHCATDVKSRERGHFSGYIDTCLQKQHPMGISS
jgi:hypothetical protein